MKIAGRSLGTILRAPFQAPHYIAAANMLRLYVEPVDAYARYLLGSGDYPVTIEVRSPTGPVRLVAYSRHDMLTINEVFCRADYRASEADKVVVDLGSNIGVSAAYFLSRSPDVFAYLFEPLPMNVVRLESNLRPFEGRYQLVQLAVGLQEGEVEFGWEETGRYGGIGQPTGRYVTVKCVDSNGVLSSIIERHSQIDILKIDIEGLEKAVVEHISPKLARRIRTIYAECRYSGAHPLRETHDYRQYGSIAHFTRRLHVA